MRSSRMVRASGCQCQSRNSPGFDPSVLRHSGISGAADETVLNNVGYIKKLQAQTKNNPYKPLPIQSIPLNSYLANPSLSSYCQFDY